MNVKSELTPHFVHIIKLFLKWSKASCVCVCELSQVETARLQPQAVLLQFPTVMSLWRAAVIQVHPQHATWRTEIPTRMIYRHTFFSFIRYLCSTCCRSRHTTSPAFRLQLSNHASRLPAKPHPSTGPLPFSRRIQPTGISTVLAGLCSNTCLRFVWHRSGSVPKAAVLSCVGFPVTYWAVISFGWSQRRSWAGDGDLETCESSTGEKYSSSQTHTSTWPQSE